MKSGINRILLPLSIDNGFRNAAAFAFQLAKCCGATVTVLVVDDDSPWYETTLLPFHSKELNSREVSAELSSIAANNEQLKSLHDVAAKSGGAFSQKIVTGHTATQILLQSRYHDVVVMPDNPVFADAKGDGHRRVSALLEVLDQAVVPTLLCGPQAAPELGSAAIYFDGSPAASVALHHLAYLYQCSPAEKIAVRVSTFKEPAARQLAKDAAAYLKLKGLSHVVTEYSDLSPIEYAQSHSKDRVPLAVLGVRSRQAYHDFRIGILARHFVESEPSKIKLFC